MAKGPLFLTQKMLPLMRDGGSIILVSSAIHYMGLANHSAYAGAKAALRSFVRTWAAEFKDNGIRANLLSPGPFPTAIMEAQAETPADLDALHSYFAIMFQCSGSAVLKRQHQRQFFWPLMKALS